MTYGGPISTTIFNVIVDAIIRHWVTVVAATEEVVDPAVARTEGFGWNVQRLEEYFYADNGILASMWETRLQREFDTLAEFLDRVGNRTNM